MLTGEIYCRSTRGRLCCSTKVDVAWVSRRKLGGNRYTTLFHPLRFSPDRTAMKESLSSNYPFFFQFKGSMSLPFVNLSGRFCERNREKDFVSLFLSVRLNFKEIGCVIARRYSRPVKASTFGSWRKLHREKIFKWTYSCTHTRCCSFSPYRYVKLMR